MRDVLFDLLLSWYHGQMRQWTVPTFLVSGLANVLMPRFVWRSCLTTCLITPTLLRLGSRKIRVMNRQSPVLC